METKKSNIDRVERTEDTVGWMVYFDDSQHQQRIPSKYAVEPRPGDSITLFGFPHTYGVKINGKTVFMHGKSEASMYFGDLHQHANKVHQLEKLLKITRKHAKV